MESEAEEGPGYARNVVTLPECTTEEGRPGNFNGPRVLTKLLTDAGRCWLTQAGLP